MAGSFSLYFHCWGCTLSTCTLRPIICESSFLLRLTVLLFYSSFPDESRSPSELVSVHGWSSVTDDASLHRLVDAAVAANPKLMQKYESAAKGKKKNAAFNALMGAVRKMDATANLDMKKIDQILREKLSG